MKLSGRGGARKGGQGGKSHSDGQDREHGFGFGWVSGGVRPFHEWEASQSASESPCEME